MKRPMAYITAAWSNNEFENTENAAKYCRTIYEAGFMPMCPLLFVPLFINDEIPQEHKDGIDIGRDMLRRSHGGNPIYINLNVRKKLDKVLMSGKLTEQTVVNPTAFQKCHHLIIQMQLC